MTLRKIITILFVVLSGLCATHGQDFEFTYKGQTLRYVVMEDDEVKVISLYRKISGNVEIPENIEFQEKKYKVTRIGWSAFFKQNI